MLFLENPMDGIRSLLHVGLEYLHYLIPRKESKETIQDPLPNDTLSLRCHVVSSSLPFYKDIVGLVCDYDVCPLRSIDDLIFLIHGLIRLVQMDIRLKPNGFKVFLQTTCLTKPKHFSKEISIRTFEFLTVGETRLLLWTQRTSSSVCQDEIVEIADCIPRWNCLKSNMNYFFHLRAHTCLLPFIGWKFPSVIKNLRILYDQARITTRDVMKVIASVDLPTDDVCNLIESLTYNLTLQRTTMLRSTRMVSQQVIHVDGNGIQIKCLVPHPIPESHVRIAYLQNVGCDRKSYLYGEYHLKDEATPRFVVGKFDVEGPRSRIHGWQWSYELKYLLPWLLVQLDALGYMSRNLGSWIQDMVNP